MKCLTSNYRNFNLMYSRHLLISVLRKENEFKVKLHFNLFIVELLHLSLNSHLAPRSAMWLNRAPNGVAAQCDSK